MEKKKTITLNVSINKCDAIFLLPTIAVTNNYRSYEINVAIFNRCVTLTINY